MPTLYHCTTARAAKAIRADGFRDSRGDYGFRGHDGSPIKVEGVWLSDRPLDCKDFGHIDRDALLAVTLNDDDLVDREIVQEGWSHREWLVPAAVINQNGTVRLVSVEEQTEPLPRWVKISSRWWDAAGMSTFRPTLSAYRGEPHATLATVILAIEEISVDLRGEGISDFTAERMISVLKAMRLDQPLPPVEVEVDDAWERFPYRLYHGYHRFHASIAVGFSHIPAVIVDMQDLRHMDEGKR
jgi:hypothetical protein